MATKRQLVAAAEADRRHRKLDVYADFLKTARSYRNAIRPYVIARAAIRDVDVLAQAADAAAQFVLLVAESKETLTACRDILRAMGKSQELLHARYQPLRRARWSEANEAMTLHLRQFHMAAREELSVSGVEGSWFLTRGKPPKQTDGI
jgi:hypothetical protein